MDDLISRQAAIDILDDYQVMVENGEENPYSWARLRMSELPSAQPERKRGEWEEIEVIADAYDISGVKTWASQMKCDKCGFTTIAIEGHFSQYNFCPSCGAKMVDELPSAKPEIVRCKDCEFCTEEERWCRRLGLCGAFDPSDYCSHAERSE